MNDTLRIWKAVEKTDPARTKNFSRGGGFKGTAISPMYLIHRATELWGPMGDKWGIRIIAEKILEGATIFGKNDKGQTDTSIVLGRELVHSLQAEIFYPNGGSSPTEADEGRVPCFGLTTFVGTNKYGPFTDEEAPKKSLTDALTKGLSWLGFAADVHMGLFDDSKYVADRRREVEEENHKKPNSVKIPDQVEAWVKKLGTNPTVDQLNEWIPETVELTKEDSVKVWKLIYSYADKHDLEVPKGGKFFVKKQGAHA